MRNVPFPMSRGNKACKVDSEQRKRYLQNKLFTFCENKFSWGHEALEKHAKADGKDSRRIYQIKLRISRHLAKKSLSSNHSSQLAHTSGTQLEIQF